MRLTSACLLALAALLLIGSGESAHADDPVHITTTINYEVRWDEPAVFVTWDVSFENNDPETAPNGSGPTLFYDGVTLPILAGASELSARSMAGVELATTLEPSEADLLDLVNVSFDREIFFGETYDFTLTYVLAETRGDTLLVTPYYILVPLITAGDPP